MALRTQITSQIVLYCYVYIDIHFSAEIETLLHFYK